MNYLFLDVYKEAHYRISKDTAGGYGTSNDLGDGIFGSVASRVIKKSIFWPNLSFAQLLQQLVSQGHHCRYKRVGENCDIPILDGIDAILICSSIVCFETEIKWLNAISSFFLKPIIMCGTFISKTPLTLPDNCIILSGNYELIDLKIFQDPSLIFGLKDNELVFGKDTDAANQLVTIRWGENGLPIPKNALISGQKAFLPVIFNRGCPYSCSEYCTYPTTQGRKVFSPSIDNTIKNLKELASLYPGAHVVFRDPVFSIDIKQAKDLLGEIVNSDLDLEFSAELHLRNLDEEFIKLASKAKFTTLKFGIESAFEHIRKSVKRISVDNDEQFHKISLLKRNNIKSVGMFILAQPSDTYETCIGTIEYSKALSLNIAQYSVFTPYPGTATYKFMESEITAKQFENFNQYQLVYQHKTLSQKQVRQLLEKAYMSFALSRAAKFWT
ncbi:radical SAM protein [Candidatus Puniceispirillum sp.]|nr:radical SAM protein [Candidatus Puniceispirillum sp.]